MLLDIILLLLVFWRIYVSEFDINVETFYYPSKLIFIYFVSW
jgi:hypothetical protein